jgi:hypothetical protein
VDIGSASFAIHKPDGARMTFGVNANTKFVSRDGSIHGLDDLQAGMMAAVGAVENEDGSLTAVWVGAGKLPKDRPSPDRNPDERPIQPQDGRPEEDV